MDKEEFKEAFKRTYLAQDEIGRGCLAAVVVSEIINNGDIIDKNPFEGYSHGHLKRIIKRFRSDHFFSRSNSSDMVEDAISYIRREWLHKEVNKP